MHLLRLCPSLLKPPYPISVLEDKFQVIALADAVEENQDNLFQSFTRLKSATHLVILLIGLWQKLSADQIAILEAAFLPLQQDTQELVRTHKPAVVTATVIEKGCGFRKISHAYHVF
ncbi:hypothetical protein J1605_009757 [Eschrichtius robustus]|uniref:PTHB1 hairpin domain-containing protein n=1 Tax=Eschrichtius robustus TaxID=9764 RepID=A0AB34GUH7_ESCRO|nr:hypothetical protein J1605_009757 [Eschrichtius robustus]